MSDHALRGFVAGFIAGWVVRLLVEIYIDVRDAPDDVALDEQDQPWDITYPPFGAPGPIRGLGPNYEVRTWDLS